MADILLIDGDVLAYHACRPRWLKTATIENGKAHIQLDVDGKKIPLEYSEDDDSKYLEESWTNFKQDLENLKDYLWTSDYLMAVGGRDNFRKTMYPEYKMNRHKEGVKQNEFVPVIRERAVDEGLAVFADNREADDYLRVWAEECREYNLEHIICSVDKDLRCIPGKYFNIKKKNGKFINEVENISEMDAIKLYYNQLLQGDPTDKIPGIPGLGPVIAKRLIAPCKTEEEMQELVVDEYIKAFGYEEWKDYLLSNGKMIHLQKNLNDYFTISDWDIIKELE